MVYTWEIWTTRSDSRCHSFAGLGAMSLLVECGWRVRWQMCVRRFQGRNTVGKNRGWDTWTERHCHTRPRTDDPLSSGQLWEHLEIVWVRRIGDSAVSKVLVDRYDLLVQSSVVAAAGKTDRVIMIGLTTLGHAHRFVHMAYYYLLFVKYLFWCHSILYAS